MPAGRHVTALPSVAMTPRPCFFVSLVRKLPAEFYVWAGALAALAWTDPRADGLFDLCVWKAIGVAFCPGCGLGHAVAFLLDGEWESSWAAHPLALPAVALLASRAVLLLRDAYRRARSSTPGLPATC